jgi:hypothetical protein
MNMPKNLQLRIDDPCSEKWDQMRPKEQGRHCSSCKKTVVDFTLMSDREVIDWFAKPKESVCGRFLGGQLNRELTPQPERKNGRLGWWSYLLTGLLMSLEVSAQTRPDSPAVARHDNRDTLRGRLVDADNGQPVSYASITTAPMHGYIADPEGYFVIPRKAIPDRHTLTISAIGYRTSVIDVVKTWKDDQQQIIPVVRMEQTLMGDVVIVAGKVSTSKKPVTTPKKTTTIALTLYPNPVARGASLTLSVQLDEPGTYTVQLFSLSGIPVSTMEVEGDTKPKNISMDIPATLAAGTYFVRLSHPAVKKVYTQQVVVF